MSFHVLVIDDDADTRENLWDILELQGYGVETAGTASEALQPRAWEKIGAIILDRRLPDSTAEALIPDLKRIAPEAEVLVITGFADLHGAVTAFRLGAVDYILKPIDPAELSARLNRIAERRRDRQELRAAQEAKEQALADLQTRSEELRSTTQQLWQAARLAGVGELAASIAHELNNPLGIVHLRLESLLAKTPPDDPRFRSLQVVDHEIERMARLVANLLHFSRPGRDRVSTVDIVDEVSKTIELTEHHFKRRNVEVRAEATEPVPEIFADRQQLRQVFLNLFTNAADAMPHGGELRLHVREDTIPPDRRAVAVEVADNGHGIRPEHLAHVTEPFFSTKEEGKGTGLGLAICRRIVEQHEGLLHIASEVGRGTTVRVVLPVANGENVSGLSAGS